MSGPVLHLFTPLPWQIAPWRSQAPVLLLTGSAGGGKSRLAAEKCHAFCLRYPGATALALRKTRASMINSTVLFLEREVIGRSPLVRHARSKSRWEYANGSILAYGGMANDEQRENIRSIGQKGGVDLLWMEEATKFTEADFNEARARMRGRAAPWRQMMLSTNPDGPAHWINRRLIGGGGAETHFSQAAHNAHLPPDYGEVLAGLTGIQRERLALGKWVMAEGVVYRDYSPEAHLADRPADRTLAAWRKYRSIDFGFTNPAVCQWWAEDDDGALWLYREWYHTGLTAKELGEVIRACSHGESYAWTVADHDAGDRAVLRGECGIPTVPAIKDIRQGVQKVMERLRARKNGRPGLFICRGARVKEDPRLASARKPTCTEEEIASYVWDEGRRSQDGQEFPLKENDHGMDAMRYMVMKRDAAAGRMTISF